MQERVLSEPVYLLDDFFGSKKVHMAKVGKALETTLRVRLVCENFRLWLL
jgi:hypothetical protein